MNDLTEFLLNLVNNPTQAEKFHKNRKAAIEAADMSQEDKEKLAKMLEDTPPPAQPLMQAGRFYVGSNKGHHIKVVSSATVDILEDEEVTERMKHRIKVVDAKQAYPDAKRMILEPVENSTVYLDDVLNSEADRVKAKLIALTIEVEDDDNDISSDVK